MTARAFLRDRLPAILIRAFAHLLTVIFLLAFRIPHQALAAAILLPLCGAVPAELWEYRRRKRFYDRLRNTQDIIQRMIDDFDHTHQQYNLRDQRDKRSQRIILFLFIKSRFCT